MTGIIKFLLIALLPSWFHMFSFLHRSYQSVLSIAHGNASLPITSLYAGVKLRFHHYQLALMLYLLLHVVHISVSYCIHQWQRNCQHRPIMLLLPTQCHWFGFLITQYLKFQVRLDYSQMTACRLLLWSRHLSGQSAK
jgi:hypothetical protein